MQLLKKGFLFVSLVLPLAAFSQRKAIPFVPVCIDSAIAHIDEYPEYPDGVDSLYLFVKSNFSISKDSECLPEEKIVVGFTIDSLGSVIDPEILKGDCHVSNNEALRVIGMFPKWKPGKIDGKNANIPFNLPIYVELRQ